MNGWMDGWMGGWAAACVALLALVACLRLWLSWFCRPGLRVGGAGWRMPAGACALSVRGAAAAVRLGLLRLLWWVGCCGWRGLTRVCLCVRVCVCSGRKAGGKSGYSFSAHKGLQLEPTVIMVSSLVFLASVLVLHFVGKMARG